MFRGDKKSILYWFREWRRILGQAPRELRPRLQRLFGKIMVYMLGGREDWARERAEEAVNMIVRHQARVRNEIVEAAINAADMAGLRAATKEQVRRAVRDEWWEFEAHRRPILMNTTARLMDKAHEIVASEMGGQIPPPPGTPASGYPEGVWGRVEARINRNAKATAKAAALTETHAAAISAQHKAVMNLGIPIETKTWAATHDHRTRPAHREADGQTVPVDEPFIVDGYPIPLPGDASMGAPPELIVNCRCGCIYDAPRE